MAGKSAKSLDLFLELPFVSTEMTTEKARNHLDKNQYSQHLPYDDTLGMLSLDIQGHTDSDSVSLGPTRTSDFKI